MNWSNWAEFWAMGGHARYVWGSFAMVALVLAAEWAQLAWRRRLARRPEGLRDVALDKEVKAHEAANET